MQHAEEVWNAVCHRSKRCQERHAQVVGASGAVMGFVGLTLADLVVNSGGPLNMLLRLAVITAAAIFLIVTSVTKARIAPKTANHTSHCFN